MLCRPRIFDDTCIYSHAARGPIEKYSRYFSGNVPAGVRETGRARTFRKTGGGGVPGLDGDERRRASCTHIFRARDTDERGSKRNAKIARLVLYVTMSLWRPSKIRREKNNTVCIRETRERNARRSSGRRNRLRSNCFVYDVFFSYSFFPIHIHRIYVIISTFSY